MASFICMTDSWAERHLATQTFELRLLRATHLTKHTNDDQGNGGNAILRQGEQNAEGIRPREWVYSIKRLTGQMYMHLWSEQTSKGCRERTRSNIETPNTVTTPQKELDPYSKFTWTLLYVEKWKEHWSANTDLWFLSITCITERANCLSQGSVPVKSYYGGLAQLDFYCISVASHST